MKTVQLGLFTCMIAVSFTAIAQIKNQPKTQAQALASNSIGSSSTEGLLPVNLTQSPLPEGITSTSKKWAGVISLNPSSDYNSSSSLNVTTKIGGSYKVFEKYKILLAQAFETVPLKPYYSEDLKADIDHNNFRSMYTDLGFSTNVPGTLRSDDISLALMARILNHDSIYNKTLDAGIRTKYDFNISIPYTVTPKLNLSLFTQLRHYQKAAIEQANDHMTNRLLFGPTISYALSDRLTFYQILSSMTSLIDGTDFRRSRERAYLETGLRITPPIKGLSISLNVNQEKEILAKKGYTVTPFTLYKPHDGVLDSDGYNRAENGEKINDYVTYAGLISYSF